MPGASSRQPVADPESSLAFAYTMNRTSYGVLPGPKAFDVVDALYGA